MVAQALPHVRGVNNVFSLLPRVLCGLGLHQTSCMKPFYVFLFVLYYVFRPLLLHLSTICIAFLSVDANVSF